MNLPIIDGALFFDNSALENLACPRKFYYKVIERIVKSGTSAGANFGSTVHRGLETRYKLCNTSPVIYDKQIKCDKCKGTGQFSDVLNATWQTCSVCQGSGSSSAPVQINFSMLEWLDAHPQPQTEFRNYGHACNMLAVYNQQYGQEAFKILTTPEGKPLVEASFALPFALLVKFEEYYTVFEWDGDEDFYRLQKQAAASRGMFCIKVYYTGKIDLGIEDNSGIWSFDHKTAFQFGDGFLQQMDMDAGQLGYMWALQQVTGKQACGYIIDAIRVRRPKKSDDPMAGSIDATDFFRRPFFKPQETLLEWRKNVLSIILNIANMVEQGDFPMHRSQCISKYGACEFIDVCSTPPSQRDLIKNSGMYEENKWSPLKGVEAAGATE